MPQSLYPLLLLACPIGMGLMMWFMMRDGTHRRTKSHDSSESQLTQTDVALLREEIAHLRAERGSGADLSKK